MKLLLALRILGIAVAALTIVLPWAFPALLASRIGIVRRLALALGLGAQLGITGVEIARGRAAWTKLVFPVIGSLAALEATFAHAVPWWALGVVAACELALVAFVVARAVRIGRTRLDDVPETILQAEFARFVDARLARFFALEATLMVAAMRFICGGFSRPGPPGFSYAARSDIPLLLALPVFVILPEMIVVDLLVPAQAWMWRLASDAFHVYAMLWAIGAYATFRNRPHHLDRDRARVRFSFGAFQTLDVDRSRIRSAIAMPATFDARAWRRALRDDGASLAASGASVVRIEFAEPIAFAGWRRMRNVSSIVVSADRPHELARALAAT